MDLFQTLAECSIAFAGFGALHAVVAGGDTPRIMHRAFTIVLTGSLAFILSIVAVLLGEFGFDAEALWQLASGVGIVVVGIGAAFFYAGHIRTTQAGHRPQSPVFFAIAASLLLSALPILLMNGIGWLWQPSALAYGAALILILSSGIIALLGCFWFPVATAVRDAESMLSKDASD